MDGDRQAALDRAAEETYRRVDVDVAESPEPLRPLLAEIRGGLYDRTYRPPAVGSRGSGARAFRRYFGTTPLDYLRGARLETSMRLLRDTDLSIGDVALLVGYSDYSGFRRAFRKWFAMTPRHFRDNARRISRRTGWPDDEILSFHLWLRAAAGEKAAIERLRDWVRTLHPRAKVPKQAESTDEKFWRGLAAGLLERISDRPVAEQRRMLQRFYFGDPALCHLLVEKSRRAEDPRRALELAELASAAVEGSAEHLGDLLPHLRFLVRVRLAEVRPKARAAADR